MEKISKNRSVILVKIYIAFAGIWLLATLSVGFCFESGIHPEWEYLFLFMVITLIGLGMFLMVIMSRIDISPARISPQIFSLRKMETLEMKEKLLQASDAIGFKSTVVTPLTNVSEIVTSFRSQRNAIYAFQTIWIPEYSAVVVEKATDIFWNEIKKHIDGTENVAIALIQCVCVEAVTPSFHTFVKKNIPQDYKRYQLLSGLALSKQRLYIRQSKGNFFRPYYRHLEQLFRKIIKDVVKE